MNTRMLLLLGKNDDEEFKELIEGFTNEELDKILYDTPCEYRGEEIRFWFEKFKNALRKAKAKKSR